jgi:hypothetical protein
MPVVLQQILIALSSQSTFILVALFMLWRQGQRIGDPIITVLGTLLFLNLVLAVIFTTQLRKPGGSDSAP